MSGHLRGKLFDADGHDRAIDIERDGLPETGSRQLVWVDLDLDIDDDLPAVLIDRLGVEPHEHRRILRQAGRVGVFASTGRYHLTVVAMEPGGDRGEEPVAHEVDLVAVPGLVMSLHRGRVAALERFADGLGTETSLGVLDAGDLLSALVDELLTGYLEVAETIERRIDRLDDLALRGRPEVDVLGEIVHIRRHISVVRRTLAPHRAALATLARPEMDADDELGAPWPGLVDRVEHASQSIESLRTALLGTYDIHMGRAAQRANDVMKLLTLLSAVLLPAVVLAGIMGMNFQLGFFDDPGNVWLVLGAMVGLSVAILGIARWQRWW